MKNIMKSLFQPEKLQGKIFRATAMSLWLTLYIYTFAKLYSAANGIVFFGLLFLLIGSAVDCVIKLIDALSAIKNKRPIRNFHFRAEEPKGTVTEDEFRKLYEAIRDRKN